MRTISTITAGLAMAAGTAFAALDPGLDPTADYSGQYLPEGTREGVFVTQNGNTAFITFLYYGDDGRPTWAVASDAKWEAASRSFVGYVQRVEVLRNVGPGGSGTLTSMQYLGQVRFTPTDFDKGRLDITLPQPQTRYLTRLRF